MTETDSTQPDGGLSRRVLLALAAAGAGYLVLGDARSAQASPVWAGGWSSPLNDASPTVNSGFLELYTDVDYHLGLDLHANFGDPVYSIGPGTVLSTQTGNYVGQALFIKYTAHDGTDFVVVYGHVATNVTGTVVAGQQIATIGWHHLHFGLRTTISTDPRWGQWANADYPFSNGFTDPVPFLTAHPLGVGIPSTQENDMQLVQIVFDDGPAHPDFASTAVYNPTIGWVQTSVGYGPRDSFNAYGAIADRLGFTVTVVHVNHDGWVLSQLFKAPV